MMEILLTAATEAEIGLSIKHIAPAAKQAQSTVIEYNGHNIHFAATGVGMVPTTYNLTRLLAKNNFDFVLQAGVAGSFDRDISLGDVYLVRTDRFARMGAEDGEGFIDVFDIGLIQSDGLPFTNKALVNPLLKADYGLALPEVEALTVHTVTGSEATTRLLTEQYQCQLESMEGAAFHYVCLQEGVPFAQVRAVSNYVERRNRVAWKMEEAISHLNNQLVTLFNNISL